MVSSKASLSPSRQRYLGLRDHYIGAQRRPWRRLALPPTGLMWLSAQTGPCSLFVSHLGNADADVIFAMRYLVKAKVKAGRAAALAEAIAERTLGHGSIAGDEYLCDMQAARVN